MITKRTQRTARPPAPPLDVKLTVAFRFGDEPGDRVTVMNDRSIPLVGTVFESRDRILRSFTELLFKAAAVQPKVASELLPALKLIGGFGRQHQKPAASSAKRRSPKTR